MRCTKGPRRHYLMEALLKDIRARAAYNRKSSTDLFLWLIKRAAEQAGVKPLDWVKDVCFDDEYDERARQA